MNRRLHWVAVLAAAALLSVLPALLLFRKVKANPTGLAALRVPPGFQVELVAGPELVSYPMMGTLDPRGRLFLCESSGRSQTNEQMKANPQYRIRMLEDRDGDGIYDRSTVFADKLTLPAGAVWHRGGLYVASPPDLLRFEDTNDDGVAERREVVLTGWNLSSNAASLHGPFFGPDGWLYLTDGRHGFDIKTKDGRSWKGKASRIWRARPDGTGLEWVSGGGFDNPVELVFTPAGEIIGTMTYFTDPKDGMRDALLHFVEGGIYPKWHPVISEFQRTGDLMPVMTKFARIAPSGLVRYRSAAFGPQYRDNLFSAQFNTHRVERHILIRDGATFRTQDEDFLTSSDPDFHPTDVMEDADGSLLVVDTGAWFIHGCPLSRVPKPQIQGAVYRVRRVGARPIQDPRGLSLKLESMPPDRLAGRLEDERPAVRDRAVELLVEAGEASVAPLRGTTRTSPSGEVRASAVFALFRIGTAQAREAVREALGDSDLLVRVAAARCAGMARDPLAKPRLMDLVKNDHPAVRRQAAAALGQIGDPDAGAALLEAAANVEDRFLEHAIVYSLITLRTPGPLTAALKNPSPKVRKVALIALDQMDRSPLASQQLRAFFDEPDKDLRRAALWVASHHPKWSGEVLKFLRSRLLGSELLPEEAEAVGEAILTFSGNADVQAMLAALLGGPGLDPARQLFLLNTIDRAPLKELPASWIAGLGRLLENSDESVRLRAVKVIRAHGVASLDERLERMAINGAASDELRATALGALVMRHPQLSEPKFQFLLERLDPKTDAVLRQTVSQVLGKAGLSKDQLLVLARQQLPRTDPLVLPAVLEAFRNSKDQEVGETLVAVLEKSPVAAGTLGVERLKKLLEGYPAPVQASANRLFAQLAQAQKSRIERLRRLEPLLTAGGDVARGRQIFFGAKVACSSCHTIGPAGGHVGPDLTGIGAIRSGHDLLEAIVFPSESFVPGFEIYNVETETERLSGVRGESTPDTVVLITGPNAEVRIPRSKIKSMKASNVSLMPEGLDHSLTPAEFADLLAFLQAQKSREIAESRQR